MAVDILEPGSGGWKGRHFVPEAERHRVAQALGKGHEAVEDGEVGWVTLGPGFQVGQPVSTGFSARNFMPFVSTGCTSQR